MISARNLFFAGGLALAPFVANAQAPATEAPSTEAPLVAGSQTPVTEAPPMMASANDYVIGTGDQLQVFVWRNPDLSATVPVRPDGKITTPLVQDMQAQGRTPSELAANLRTALAQYIKEPIVNVVVREFASARSTAAIRVIGAATAPKAVPYRTGITALDVLVEVGGLTPYASGNRAQIIRNVDGKTTAIPLRLSDLMNSGKLKANVELKPGDIIRIPQRAF